MQWEQTTKVRRPKVPGGGGPVPESPPHPIAVSPGRPQERRASDIWTSSALALKGLHTSSESDRCAPGDGFLSAAGLAAFLGGSRRQSWALGSGTPRMEVLAAEILLALL